MLRTLHASSWLIYVTKPIYSHVLAWALDEYAAALQGWDNRQGEAEALRARANQVKVPSGIPSPAYSLKGWAIDGIEYEG